MLALQYAFKIIIIIIKLFVKQKKLNEGVHLKTKPKHLPPLFCKKSVDFLKQWLLYRVADFTMQIRFEM